MTHVETTMLTEQVLEVRLNRPDQLNAISPDMLEGIIDAMRQANHSRAIRVVILTGEGRGFCAGADLTTQSGRLGMLIKTHTKDRGKVFLQCNKAVQGGPQAIAMYW